MEQRSMMYIFLVLNEETSVSFIEEYCKLHLINSSFYTT